LEIPGEDGQIMKTSGWGFGVASMTAVLIVAGSALAGQPAHPIPFPHGYRSWQHVKSIVVGPEHKSFPTRGGIHHYYANDKAIEGYRSGRFPNGSVIVDEGVFTKDGEGQTKGILLEGDRRFLDVMVKDDRLYNETGGWGFDHFEGQERTGVLTVNERSKCYECHAKRKERDHVFTSIRP
jgi:hypothetical protein